MPHVLLSWSPTHTISAQKSGSPPISRRSKSPPTETEAPAVDDEGPKAPKSGGRGAGRSLGERPGQGGNEEDARG